MELFFNIQIFAFHFRLLNGISYDPKLPQCITTSSWDVVDTFSATKVNNNLESKIAMGNTKSMNGNSSTEVTEFSEIRSLRRIHRIDESVGTDGFDILEMKGIVHPETKVILTVEEAIRLRILDVRTGKIAVNPNSKSAYISIEEAVQRRLVIPELAERLLGPCGITPDDGKAPLSLLEAIQRELIDAERGPMERLKVNLLDEQQSSSIADEVAPSPLHILSSINDQQITILNLPLTLYDLLNLGLVDRKSGLILDRDTGQRCSIATAIERRILDPDVREVVDAAEDNKVTLNEALLRELIKDEKYFHKLSGERISLHEAKHRRLIIKPLSLKDCIDLEVLGENNVFKSPIYRHDLSMAEAIDRAVIDLKIRKTIMDVSNGELLSLSEALRDGVITSNCCYMDKTSCEIMSLQQAAERGLLFTVSIKSLFEIPAFRTEDNEEFMNLISALDAKLIIMDNKVLKYKRNSGELISLLQAANKSLIKPDMLKMFDMKIGIKRESQELTVIEAAVAGYINCVTGFVIDKCKNVDVPFLEAVKLNLITEEGVATLKSLLAITLSTQTVTKTVVSYSTTFCFPVSYKDVGKLESTDVSSLVQHDKINLKETTNKIKSTFPMKEKIIRMLQPLEMRDRRVSERHKLTSQIDVPPEGWDLEIAIDENLMDPVTGLLTIPGIDRQVSFEECVQLEMINSKSAVVIEPQKGRKLTLKKSLEKDVLDCTGHYQTEKEKLTMKEAIERSLICFKTKDEKRSKLYIKSSEEDALEKVVTVNLEPVRICPKVIFDPETTLVIFVDSNMSDDMCNAVKTGKLNPSEVKIRLPEVECYLSEAIERGMIDLDNRTCIDYKGEKILLNEAIKTGVAVVLGQPLVASKAVTNEDVSQIPLKDIDDANNLLSNNECDEPSLATLTRTRVTTEPKYLVSIGKAKSATSNVDAGHPVLLQKMRKKKVKPKEAIPCGIIDKNTAELLESLTDLKDSDGKQLALFKALDLTQTNPNAKIIKDPRTRDMISIKEAVDRGILDQSSEHIQLLVPVARSLSLPNLLKQGLIDNGKIIHPETGNDLSLPEAIACDIVDPLSKIKDPITGNVLTLEDAMNVGLVQNDLQIKVENTELNVAAATEKGDIFIEEENNVFLPPAAMTLPVALSKGLYNTVTNQVRRPITGEFIPLNEAIKEELIMTLPQDEDLLQAETILSEQNIGLSYTLNSDTVIYDEGKIEESTGKQTIETNLFKSEICKLKDYSDENGTLHIKDAIKMGLLTAVGAPILAGTAVIDAFRESNRKPSAETETPAVRYSPITLTKHLTPSDLASRGSYDLKRKMFLNLKTGRPTEFKNVILNEELFNVEKLYVKDLVEFDSYIPLRNALAFGILDDQGFITDPNTGKRISFFESIKLGWICELEEPLVGNIDFSNALTTGLIDRESCSVIAMDSVLGQPSMDLLKCLKSGFINIDSVLVRNLKTNETISLFEAVNTGLINFTDDIVDTGEETCNLVTAFHKAVLLPNRIPVSLIAVIRQGLYNKDENKIFDSALAEYVTLEESINRRIIDPTLVRCMDVKAREFVSLETAMKSGLIDDGQLVHTILGKKMKLDKSVEQNLITNEHFNMNLIEAVERKYYNPKLKKILNPCSGEFVTVEEAIDSQLVDISLIGVRSSRQGEYMSIMEAVSKGILDLHKGVLVQPTEMTLDLAIRQKYLTELPSLSDSTMQSCLEDSKVFKELEFLSISKRENAEWPPLFLTSWAELTLNRQQPAKSNLEYTLINAIQQQLLDAEIAVMKNRLTKEFVSVKELLETGVLKPELKIKFIPSFNPNLPVRKAISDKGTIYTTTPLSFEKALSSKGLNTRSRRFKDNNSGLTLSLKDAVNTGFIDPDSALLKDYANKRFLSLAEAFNKGMFDCDKNTIVDTNTSRLLSLSEALESELIVTRAVSLIDALHFGLYNSYTGLFTDPFQAATDRSVSSRVEICKRELNLKQCIKEGIIESSSIVLKDPDGCILDYETATKKMVLDPIMGLFFEKSTGKSIDLIKAMNRRYILSPISRVSGHLHTSFLCWELFILLQYTYVSVFFGF